MRDEGVEIVGVNYSFEKLYKKEEAMGHLIEVAQVQMNVCFPLAKRFLHVFVC